MPVITARDLKDAYDVIIVGSGAGGGQAAYTLTLEGAKVLLLEAGGNYDPMTQTPMFNLPSQAPLRGASTPDLQGGFFDATRGGGWKIEGEPFVCASDRPGENFEWWRPRMLGGRTNHWGRISLRNGPYDFKARTRDGLGFDWPISYEDLAPYYDKVEMLVGVYGTNEGLENTPDSSPGCLLPPPKPNVHDLLFKKAARSQGIPVVAAHRAVLTVPQDAKRLPAKLHPGNGFAQKIVREAMEGRAACFWATNCNRGCSIKANYQSTTVHLPPAMATGNLDILPNAMAREIVLGKDGRARAVALIDKSTDNELQASGRVVVLAAGTCESVRLLLNSKSTRYPQGLANSSGLVGRHLMDSVGSSLVGQIPLLEALPPHNQDGAGAGGGVYSPWWLYRRQQAGEMDFPRGYHIEFKGGRTMPDLKSGAGLEWLTRGSYGRKFKDDARRYYGSFVNFDGRGEMVPNPGSFCEIDPETKDKWGIPVLRFHWKWSDHETRQAAHMQKTFAGVIEAMGGRSRRPAETNGAAAIKNGGSVIHEVGGAMMGDDPRKSVTNRWCQTHDVKNLFLVDGATFASNADKNPTLTIMALSWRASDYIAAAVTRGDL